MKEKRVVVADHELNEKIEKKKEKDGEIIGKFKERIDGDKPPRIE